MGYNVNEDGSVTRHDGGRYRKCHKCGATGIPEDAKFCPHCGAELGDGQASKGMPKSSMPSSSIDPRKKKIFLIVLVAVVFFVGFLVIGCGVYNNDPIFMLIVDVILTAFLSWMLYMEI